VLSVVSLLLTCDGLSALCGFQEVSVRGVGARGGVAGLLRGRSVGFWPRAELSSMKERVWGVVIARTYLRCTVQGKTALIRAAENGNEAQVKQLIVAKANPNAKDVIYRSCARVSLSECSKLPAPDITLKIKIL